MFMNNIANQILENKSIYYWTYWFKGILCLILHKLGAKIVGYSLKPKKSLYNQLKINKFVSKSYYNNIKIILH